jgi:hypothetical protein
MQPFRIGSRVIVGTDRITLTGVTPTFQNGTGLARYFARIRSGMTVAQYRAIIDDVPPVTGVNQRPNFRGLLDNYLKNGLITIGPCPAKRDAAHAAPRPVRGWLPPR